MIDKKMLRGAISSGQKKKRKRRKVEDIKARLAQLQKLGKKHLYEGFVIDRTNEEQFKDLIYWFVGDPEFEKRGKEGEERSLDKGVILFGGVGTGKSDAMILMKVFCEEHKFKPLRIEATEAVSDFFSSNRAVDGFKYFKYHNYCFDDLAGDGEEIEVWFFKTRVEPMKKVIATRYRNWKENGVITHLTTNVNFAIIKKLYGVRFEDRLKEMFNKIVFTGESRRG